MELDKIPAFLKQIRHRDNTVNYATRQRADVQTSISDMCLLRQICATSSRVIGEPRIWDEYYPDNVTRKVEQKMTMEKCYFNTLYMMFQSLNAHPLGPPLQTTTNPRHIQYCSSCWSNSCFVVFISRQQFLGEPSLQT